MKISMSRGVMTKTIKMIWKIITTTWIIRMKMTFMKMNRYMIKFKVINLVILSLINLIFGK